MNLNKYKVRKIFENSLIHFFLIIVAVTCLFPLFWMVRSALMTKEAVFLDKSLIPEVIQFSNFSRAWIDGNFGIYLFNSIFYTVSVVGGIVLISSLAAYGFSRLDFPGKNAFFYMFVAAMMIPLPGSFVPYTGRILKIRGHFVEKRL